MSGMGMNLQLGCTTTATTTSSVPLQPVPGPLLHPGAYAVPGVAAAVPLNTTTSHSSTAAVQQQQQQHLQLSEGLLAVGEQSQQPQPQQQ